MNMGDFSPTPVVGNQYKKTDGTIVAVRAVDYVNGQLYVLFEANGKESSVYQDGWNEMKLTEARIQGGEPPSPPSDTSDNRPTVKQEDLAPVSETDNKVQRLLKVLGGGPSSDLNPSFYSTDFAQNVSSNELVDDEVVSRLDKQLNDIQNLRKQGEKTRSGAINELLWTCAGVDKPLLRMCQSDWSKKAGVGGTILGTAIFAFLSGTYAAYTVSGKWWSVFIGLVWGLFIFNLDRYLVNSMYSDGTSRITVKEWKSASPRLIIAIFIGIVISTPIEMAMFNGRIQDEIQKVHQLSQDETAVYASNSRLLQLKNELEKQQVLVDTLNNQVLRYRFNLHKEVTREDRPNYGPRAAVIDTLLQQTIRSYNTEKDKLDTIMVMHDTLYNAALNSLKIRDSLQNDFSTRLEMMLKITGKHYQNPHLKTTVDNVETEKSTSTIAKWLKEFWPDNSLFWVRLLIMCFFMLIELTPVLAKMMAEDGKYEEYIIQESRTMDKLRRVRECNDINVVIGGPLEKQIGFIFENDRYNVNNRVEEKSVQMENTSVKEENVTKQKKYLTDADNLRIYKHALERCTGYVISQIDEIFDSPSSAQVTNPKAQESETEVQKAVKEDD